jgi:transcriptional regulator with XRE-family HTH domain
VSLAFGNLIRALVEGFAGTKREFAREATIAPSVLSRLLGGGRPPVTDVCLRIAKAGGVSASVVLRAAGHTHTADLLETLYGKPRVVRPEGTAEDRALFADVQTLDAKTRRAIRTLIAYHQSVSDDDDGPVARPRRRSTVPRKTRRAEAAEKQTA